ncbi:allantoate deiminase [Cytobacillus firmus]|uniref:Allantoate deiminase n=2 Tax=Cytobacillus TaxID=2675230 RepID=A0A366JZP5_CYTFI|nr:MULTISPECIES: Zn-dependent hydrolase [Cytobacillus]RBP94467.1 allantoate deiminase [Cytobacillus firmus]TDX43214.1 allantoate deiminase [Cytobacillus oceanisediminis]
MEINLSRVMNDFENIIGFTSTPGNGCTRFSYSKEDRRVREYLFARMVELGMDIKVDAIGNIRATYGKELNRPSIMIGSHHDTVKNGGKYDGLTGVLAALEIIRVLKEEKAELQQPIELVSFAEEEGSNFGITMLGSKVFAGKYNLEELKAIKNSEGKSVYETAKDFGLEIDQAERDILQRGEIDAMIELHIEQGQILESQQKSIGIVQAIAGMRTYKVTIEGDSNHAGTTPMDLRSDPLAGAAEIISQVRKMAKYDALPSTVATVGKIECRPNIPNVIPQKVEFYVDIRDVEAKGVKIVSGKLAQKVEEVSDEFSLKSTIELVGKSSTVELSSRLIEKIEETAIEKGFDHLKLNSGAVHDTAMLSGLTDIGMIFIPSKGGKSHCPEEYTSEKDIKAGCDLLLNVVRKLACKKTEKQKI